MAPSKANRRKSEARKCKPATKKSNKAINSEACVEAVSSQKNFGGTSTYDRSGNEFLYKLLVELHDIHANVDPKQIQLALHELSDASKKYISPVLLAVTNQALSKNDKNGDEVKDDGMIENNSPEIPMPSSLEPSGPDGHGAVIDMISRQQSIGYWVVLSTHTLQRLLILSSKNKKGSDSDSSNMVTSNNERNKTLTSGKDNETYDEINKTTSNEVTENNINIDNNREFVDESDGVDPIVVVMAWISYYLSTILSTAKVERFTSSSTPGSRQVYGRALLVCTTAAAHSLQALTTASTNPRNITSNKDQVKEHTDDIANYDDSTMEQDSGTDFLRTTASSHYYASALQVCILALDNSVLPCPGSNSSVVGSITTSSHMASSTGPSSPIVDTSLSVGSTSSSHNLGTGNSPLSGFSVGSGIHSHSSQYMSMMWNQFKSVIRQQLHKDWYHEMSTFFSSDLFRCYDNGICGMWQQELSCLESIVRALSLRSASEIVSLSRTQPPTILPTSTGIIEPTKIKKKRKGSTVEDLTQVGSVSCGGTVEIVDSDHLIQGDDKYTFRGKKKMKTKSGSSSEDTKQASSIAASAGQVAASDQSFSLNQLFQQLLASSPSSQIKLDGRLAIKRWTAVALTWYVQGHVLLLQAALAMLLEPSNGNRTEAGKGTNRNAWKHYMNVALDESHSTIENVAGVASHKRKSVSSIHTREVLPGNVTVLWLACRLIRIVRDVGTLAGSKPPSTGGLDSYIRSLFNDESEIVDTPTSISSSSLTKRSKKRPRKAGAPSSTGGVFFSTKDTSFSAIAGTGMDVRDLSMVLSHTLIRAHHQALQSNVPLFACGGKIRRLVVNDELMIPEAHKNESKKSPCHPLATLFFGQSLAVELQEHSDFASEMRKYYCYPFICKAIDDLSHAAESPAAITLCYDGTGMGGVPTPSFSGNVYVGGGMQPIAMAEHHGKWSECIEYASAAYIVEAVTNTFPSTPLDARLVQFAVSKLHACLSMIIQSSSSGNTSSDRQNRVKRSVMEVTTESTTSTSDLSIKNHARSCGATFFSLLKDFDLFRPLPYPTLRKQSHAINKLVESAAATASGRVGRKKSTSLADDVKSGTDLMCVDDKPLRCTFGGVFDFESKDMKEHNVTHSLSMSSEEKLSLFVRSFLKENEICTTDSCTTDSVEKLAKLFSTLTSFLLQVIECCYDTRCVSQCELISTTSETPVNSEPSDVVPIHATAKNSSGTSSGKKRVFIEGHRQGKQRGVEINEGDNFSPKLMSRKRNKQIESEACVSSISYRRISGIRCCLASETLDSLQILLRRPTDTTTSSAASSKSSINSTLSFREFVGVTEMIRFIDLAVVLHQVLFGLDGSADNFESSTKSRLFVHEQTIFAAANDCPSRKKPTDPALNLTQDEKKLWISHGNVCITLGRGQVAYSSEAKTEILPESVRKTLFARIIATNDFVDPRVKPTLLSVGVENRQKLKVRWPLWLSPAHRLVVAANLSSEPCTIDACPEEQHSCPEQHIVEGFLNELSHVLETIQPVLSPKRKQITKSDTPAIVVTNLLEEIPLSLSDVRIFLMAFGRLGTNDKNIFLAFLLDTVHRYISCVKGKEDKCIVTGNKDDDRLISSFLARVMTLCVNAYLIIKFESNARDELTLVVGKTLSSHVPVIRSTDWYNAERCFVGVFNDWEELGLPKKFRSVSHTIDKHSESRLEDILEDALSIGFLTAPSDNCQLLFTAWNSLGMRDLWTAKSAPVWDGTVSGVKLSRDASTSLLELRDDMCLAYRLIRRVRRLPPGNSFMNLIEEMESVGFGNKSSTDCEEQLKILLKAMVAKSSRWIENFFDEYVHIPESRHDSVPSSVFCVVEAIAVYMSFAISSFTEPNKDFFSSTLLSVVDRSKTTRARAYSSDTENIDSEAESSVASQDALLETVERIHCVCDALGAIPAHPDWLDTECKLFAGITNQEATDCAEKALLVLTKLASVAITKVQFLHRRSLSWSSAVSQQGQPTDWMKQIGASLCWLHNYDTTSSQFGKGQYSNDERDLYMDIGSLCDIDCHFIQAMLSQCVGRSKHGARQRWSPLSAQRIIGKLQDLLRSHTMYEFNREELRLGDEWEVLLATSLRSASMHVHGDRTPDISLPAEAYQDLTQAMRWLSICWTSIDTMVPTAALFRYALASCGRKSHPLSKICTTVDSFKENRNNGVDNCRVNVQGLSSKQEDLVSFVLSVIARIPPSPTCQMIASQLLVDTNSFAEMQGSYVTGKVLSVLVELNALAELPTTSLGKKATMSPFIGELFASVLSTYFSRMGQKLYEVNISCFSCISPDCALFVDTIVADRVEVTSAQQAMKWRNLAGEIFVDVQYTHFDEALYYHRIQKGLLPLIWSNSLFTTAKTRSYFVQVVSTLAAKEYVGDINKKKNASRRWVILSPIIDILNTIDEKVIEDLLTKDVVGVSDSMTTLNASQSAPKSLALNETMFSDEIRENVCLLLLLLPLVTVRGSDSKKRFEKGQIVYDTLTNSESFSSWKRESKIVHRKMIMYLAVLYSCSNRKLGSLYSLMFDENKYMTSVTPSADLTGIENILLLLDILDELATVFSKRITSGLAFEGKDGNRISALKVPTPCTFAIKSDFTEQHWYNCYTCGLESDKGCCTLCALVCHDGHDVSYARFSSFFCDCGAPHNRTSGSGKQQVACQCLSTQPREYYLNKILKRCPQRMKCSGETLLAALDSKAVAGIIKLSYPQEGKRAFNDVVETGRKSDCIRLFLKHSKHVFDIWKTHMHPLSEQMTENDCNDSYQILRNRLMTRSGVSPIISRRSEEIESLIGIGTCQLKAASDQGLDRTKTICRRQLLDSDARGRIVLVESKSLVFCSLSPLLNSVSSSANKQSRPQNVEKSDLSVVGIVPVDFEIVGVKFAKESENLIAVWGVTDAKVLVLNERLSGVDLCIPLNVGLIGGANESSTNDCIINLHWLRGTLGILVLGSTTSIRIYDLSSTAGTSQMNPIQSVSILAEDADVFRNFVVVQRASASFWHPSALQNLSWQLYAVLNSGKIVAYTVSFFNGIFFVEEENSSIAEQQTSADVDDGDAKPIARTNGQNSHLLVYLQQSRLLVHEQKRSSSSESYFVEGLQLDCNGKIRNRFTLFPYDISGELLNRKEKTTYVTGPYTHWTELGIFHDGTSSFFSVSCCGKNVVTGKVIFLYICFNESRTFIQVNNYDRSNNEFPVPTTINGSCAFTFPCTIDDDDEFNLDTTNRCFTERIGVCLLSATGQLSIYTDRKVLPSKAVALISLTPSIKSTTEKEALEKHIEASFESDNFFLPLLSFERLRHITDSTDFLYEAEGIGRVSNIREKLSVDTEQCLISPTNDQFTFFISKRRTHHHLNPIPSVVAPSTDASPKSEMVLVGVRIYVGSKSIDSIPKYISVHGRQHQLTSQTKKWYSFPLSAQEIAMSLRNGFVAIEVGKAHNPDNNSIVDAMELYGIERSKIEKWIPSMLGSFVATNSFADRKTLSTATDLRNRSLRLSLSALGRMTELLGPFEATKEEIVFTKQLVQDTALYCDEMIATAIKSLEKSIYYDEDSRQSFHDKAVLSGCSNFLRRCQSKLDVNSKDFDDVWSSLLTTLRRCLRTSATIARHRAYNYLQAADETCHGFGSIATDASKFLIECFTKSNCTNSLVSDFVELSLLENAVAIGSRSTSEYSPRVHFGSLDGLRRLLESPNSSVIDAACSAIRRFCERYSSVKQFEEGEVDLFTVHTMEVKYACDSCNEFIDDIRYTVLDDSHPFDLCTDCYLLAKSYSASNDKGSSSSVIVKGKPIGDGPTLTCGEVDMMKAVEIKKSVVADMKQLERLNYYSRTIVDNDRSTSSLSNVSTREQPEMTPRQLLFDDFMDGLFTGIIVLLEDTLDRNAKIINSLVQLSVNLIRHSVCNRRKTEQAKRLAKALTTGLFTSLEDISSSNQECRDTCLSESIYIYLEGLISLIVSDKFALSYFTGEPSENVTIDDSDNNVVQCEIHQAPATRRQFTQGVNKGMQFYVCSKAEKIRCNYFVLADKKLAPAAPRKERQQQTQYHESMFHEHLSEFIWTNLCTPSTSGTSVMTGLRTFVERRLQSTDQSSSSTKTVPVQSLLLSLEQYAELEKQNFHDGAFCSRCRLQDLSQESVSFNLCRTYNTVDCHIPARPERFALQKILALLALIARPEIVDRSEWLPLLCKVMAAQTAANDGTSSSDDLITKTLASRSLDRLCANNRAISDAICDHFTFEFQFKQLVSIVQDILRWCVLLNEKARQCGPTWKSCEKLQWKDLGISELVGTTGLLVEDVASLQVNDLAAKALSDLCSIARKRGANWRHFCRIRAIESSPSNATPLDCYLSSPPLFVLVALAGSLNAENQLRALKLLNSALTRDHAKSGVSCHDDNKHVAITESTEISEDPLLLLGVVRDEPENILNASTKDLFSFVRQLVCQGSTTEIRRVSYRVSTKLCKYLDEQSLGELLKLLMQLPLSETGLMGKQYSEFLALLQSLFKMTQVPSLDVASYSARVQEMFSKQLVSMRYDRTNGEFVNFDTKAKGVIQRKRYDLSSCVYCRLQDRADGSSKNSPTATSSEGADRVQSSPGRTSPPRPSLSKRKWLPEQVSSYARGRLDSSRDSCTSNEFCSFFALKHRSVIYSVHLEVNDPRSRFVKMIKIYFSPRPVEKPSILKSEDYAKNWQLCGQIPLSRGGSRGTCIVTVNGKAMPVVAANLKIEYADFYDRPGSSKNADGTIVVHCPRCTRAVSNAHGVCSNCGEVAFQCRKCRHINYDGLDAFLCVECGYCASGTFLFEVNAAVASNAIAITNDRDFERLNQKSMIAARLHEEIRSALHRKLSLIVNPKKRDTFALGNSNAFSGSPGLRNAFSTFNSVDPHGESDGYHSLVNQLSKEGSAIKLIAQPETEQNDRALSLIRIARQFRSESSSRRSSDSLLIRHLGRTLDDEESASEFLGGLLEGSGALSRIAVLDPSEPLSRLLASVQNRQDRREADERERREESTADTNQGDAKKDIQNISEILKECDCLHLLMREAEREFYELDRRCKAWLRLERGDLCETPPEMDVDFHFEPSHCQNCSGGLILQLITIWIQLFLLDPDSVQITKEFVNLLLSDDASIQSRSLQDARRTAVKEIALRSKQGTGIVLNALRPRLIELYDVNASAILGKILEAGTEDESILAPYLTLAQNALSSYSNF